jgi:hypothetical protein
LWVEGRSFECFIRDYKAAYTVVTGEQLPEGYTLTNALWKMKTGLEKRRDEWLMVIFDLQFYLEDDIETGLNSSNLFLPDWSRYLVTSSDVRPRIGGSVDQDESMACGLKFARRATCLHVTTVDEAKTKQYLTDSGLDCQDLGFPAFRHTTSSSIPILRLTLSCASLRLLEISASQFHQLCLEKASEGSSPQWPGFTPVFADTTSVLWDALNDYNAAAGSFLAICSLVDRRDVPLCFIQRFPEFRNNEDRLNSAVNILRLSGLIELTVQDGVHLVSLHLLQYRWLQNKFKRIQDNEEHKYLVLNWISILHKHLVDIDADNGLDGYTYSPARFWPIFAHVAALCNLKPAYVRLFATFDYMLFMKHVGTLLVDDGLLPSLAGVAISHALSMCGMIRRRGKDQKQFDRQYVHIRQVRAMAFRKICEYRQGELELREARLVLNTCLAHDSDHKIKLRQLQDAEAHLCLQQSKWHDGIRILESLIKSPEANHEDPATMAQRHFLLSTAWANLDGFVTSLEHSQ